MTAGFLADKKQPSRGDKPGLQINMKMTGVSSGARSPGFQMPAPSYEMYEKALMFSKLQIFSMGKIGIIVPTPWGYLRNKITYVCRKVKHPGHSRCSISIS